MLLNAIRFRNAVTLEAWKESRLVLPCHLLHPHLTQHQHQQQQQRRRGPSYSSSTSNPHSNPDQHVEPEAEEGNSQETSRKQSADSDTWNPTSSSTSSTSSTSTSTSKIYPYSRANLRPSPNSKSPLFQSAIFTRPDSVFRPSSGRPSRSGRSNLEFNASDLKLKLGPLPFHPDLELDLDLASTGSESESESDSEIHLIQQALSPRLNPNPKPTPTKSSDSSLSLPPLDLLLISNHQLKLAYDSLEAAGRKADLKACLYAASRVRNLLIIQLLGANGNQTEIEEANAIQEPPGSGWLARQSREHDGNSERDHLEIRLKNLKLQDLEALPISCLLPLYLPLLRLLGAAGHYELALGVVLDMRRAGLSKLIDGESTSSSSDTREPRSVSPSGSTSLEKLDSILSASKEGAVNVKRTRSVILDHLLLAFIKGGCRQGVETVLNLITNPPFQDEPDPNQVSDQESNRGILNENSTRNWTSETYSHMIQHCLMSHNLELALSILGSASSKPSLSFSNPASSSTSSSSSTTSDPNGSGSPGFVPLTLSARKNLISLALHCRETRIAVELADWFDRSSAQRVEPRTWMQILRVAAEESDFPTIQLSYQRAVQIGLLSPDVGLFLQILSSCSRRGLGTPAYAFIKTVISDFFKHQDSNALPIHVKLCIRWALFRTCCEYEETHGSSLPLSHSHSHDLESGTESRSRIKFRKIFNHFIDFKRLELDFNPVERHGQGEGEGEREGEAEAEAEAREEEGESLTEPLTRIASSSNENLQEAIRVFEHLGKHLTFRKNGDGGVHVEIMNSLIRAANKRKAVQLAEEVYQLRNSVWNWREADRVRIRMRASNLSSPAGGDGGANGNGESWRDGKESESLDSSISISTLKPDPDSDQTLVPNLDTFHALLRTCIISSDTDRGQSLLLDLNRYGLKATSKTFELAISLNLSKPSIQDSISLFDEMKYGRGIIPNQTTYEILIRRSVRDYLRDGEGLVDWKELIMEMMRDGYRLSGYTLQYLRELGINTQQFTKWQ